MPAAKVNWLVCRESCIPGKAELKLPITVADAGTPGKVLAQSLIQSWQQKLPLPLPADAKATFSADGYRLQGCVADRGERVVLRSSFLMTRTRSIMRRSRR
jgi:DsbC/DsbD-like thiol-disulfide interchange protein